MKKKRAKLGRPRLARGMVKAHVLGIRITEDERSVIEAAAEIDGVTSSEWARRVVREAIDEIMDDDKDVRKPKGRR